MSNESNATRPGGGDGPQSGRCNTSRRTRHAIAATALVVTGALIGALGATAMNASAFGGHGHRGHGGPEHMLERARHKVAWMLASVDASDEQESRVDAIVSDAIARLAPIRAQRRANRHEFVTELLRTDINRSALEQLRRNGLDLFDQSSTVMVDAVAQAAEVLTPEQREELLNKHRRFRHAE